MDSRGRLFVGDRSNNRVQIFDQNGNFIDMWYQFGRPSGIYIDSAITGEVEFLIPDPIPDCRGTCTAEGVVADHNGLIYGAEVGPVGGIKRYVRGHPGGAWSAATETLPTRCRSRPPEETIRFG